MLAPVRIDDDCAWERCRILTVAELKSPFDEVDMRIWVLVDV